MQHTALIIACLRYNYTIMRKQLLGGLLLVVFLLSLFGCGDKPVQQNLMAAMAGLDQAYIPAFVFTNLHKQRESEIAMQRLKKEWTQ